MILNKKLIHYSCEPVQLDRSFIYERWALDSLFKPLGLWATVDGEDDWKSWCLDHNYNIDGLKCAHELILNSDANIMILSSVDDIDNFSDKYLFKNDDDDPYIDDPLSCMVIDWELVRKHFQGILINPYYYWLGLKTKRMWYYGWDCASACIWDLSCISEFKLLDSK